MFNTDTDFMFTTKLFLKYPWYQQKLNEMFFVNPHKQSYLHLDMVGEQKLCQAAERTWNVAQAGIQQLLALLLRVED